MSTQHDDPRLGLPSGSSALEDSLCPGRWRLQQTFKEMTQGEDLEVDEDDSNGGPPDDIDRDANAGKRIHKLYAGEECPEATEPERRRASQALAVDTEMHNKWAEYFRADPEAPIQAMREFRWWLNDESGQPIYSGQTDLVKIRGHAGGEADILVGDLKGLWGYHDSAVLNQQIRRYIALVAVNITEMGFTGIRSAAAYLNQPAKTLHPVLAAYEREDIEAAVFQMHMDIAAMMDENAERHPGPVQCHHCLGKLICAEYQESLSELPMPVPIGTPAEIPTKERITEVMAKLPGQSLAHLIPWFPALENTVALAKAEAKRRLRKDPLSIPGYRLKKNSPRHKVVDLVKLWQRLNKEYDIDAEEFVKLCAITKQNVEQIARDKSGLKGQALDSKLKALLDGCTMPTPVSDSLEEGTPELLPAP